MTTLTVESMFSSKSYEARLVVSTSMMLAADRKRMLVHGVSEVTQKILMLPNANPAGLAITITEIRTQPDIRPDLLILATCPQFESVDSSLK